MNDKEWDEWLEKIKMWTAQLASRLSKGVKYKVFRDCDISGMYKDIVCIDLFYQGWTTRTQVTGVMLKAVESGSKIPVKDMILCEVELSWVNLLEKLKDV